MPILGTKQLQEIIANDDVVLAAQRRVLDSQRQQALNYDNPSLENQPYLTDPQIQFQFDRTVNQLIGYIKNGARDSVSGVNVENRNSFAAIETYPQLVAFYNSYVVPSINSNPMFRRQVYKALDEIAQVADVMVQRLSSIQPQVARQQSSAFDNTGVPTYFIDIFTKIRDDCLARNLRYISPSVSDQSTVQLYPQPGQQGQMGMQQPPQPPQQFPPIIPSERDDRGRIPSQRYGSQEEQIQDNPAIQQAYQNYNRALFRGIPQEESKGPIYEAESKEPSDAPLTEQDDLEGLYRGSQNYGPYNTELWNKASKKFEIQTQPIVYSPIPEIPRDRTIHKMTILKNKLEGIKNDLEKRIRNADLLLGTLESASSDTQEQHKSQEQTIKSLKLILNKKIGLTQERISEIDSYIADPDLRRGRTETHRLLSSRGQLGPSALELRQARQAAKAAKDVPESEDQEGGRKPNKSNNVLDRILNDNKSTYDMMSKILKKKK
jgi:hypothetical protein